MDIVTQRALARLPTGTGCHVWPGSRDRDGYGTIRDGQVLRKVHRLVWSSTHGPIPDGGVICHTCDNPPCGNPDHLFLGTNASNQWDRRSKGRQAAGSKNGRAKITEADVAEIRRAYAAGGITQQVLADRYGIKQWAVSKIVNGIAWHHVYSS